MNYLAIITIIIATWVGAFGAFFLKQGSEHFSFKTMFTNKKFLLGGTLYVLSIPIYLSVLRVLPLNVAYPLTSLGYIWSAILATIYLNETVTQKRWFGIALIVLGVTLVYL